MRPVVRGLGAGTRKPWAPFGRWTFGLAVLIAGSGACQERGQADGAQQRRLESSAIEAPGGETTPPISPTTRATPIPSLGDERTPTAALETGERPTSPWVVTAPDLPPQLIACGERGFVRLTHHGFEAFSFESLERIASVELDAPLAALTLTARSTLVVGRRHVYRYYHAERSAPRFARIPLFGPVQAFADPRDIDTFWVRYLRDPELHHFTLVEASNSVTLGATLALPDFDRQHFTILPDGSPFYTTPHGLVRLRGADQRRSPEPQPAGELVGLWPAARIDRYWVGLKDGRLLQRELARGEPTRVTHDVEGVPFEADADARRLAVVSVSSRAEGARWHLSVFDRSERAHHSELSELPALLRGPRVDAAPSRARDWDNRDVCLVPGRPWVLVGGRDTLELFDHRAGELLQRW